MKSVKISLVFVAFCFCANPLLAQYNFATKISKTEHPRILLLKGEEQLLRKSIAVNPSFTKLNQAILTASDDMVNSPVLERKLEGIRLLDVSREALRRIFYLSYSYRMSGDIKYAQRAEKELIAVSEFSDWNPNHFLDVAEMALGVAIGYDWLYNFLSADSKQTIENALLTKAIEPSFDSKYADRFRSSSNWGQVCNAGIVYAALALADKNPEISDKVLGRSISMITIPMKSYDPDGAFAEGYMYWQYGTVFNIFMLDALQKCGINDLKLADFKGFSKTPYYLQHMVGTSGKSFNYMDCFPNSILNTSQFWFASQLNDPSLLWIEKSYLETERFITITDANALPLSGDQLHENKYSRFLKDRTLPALLIWGKDIDLSKVTAPAASCFVGKGATPVCLMRTSWNDCNAIYVGFKGGSPGISHGHMDVGSFVIDADGERWASDFGMQNYNSLESKGINLWNMSQESTRWKVFRYNNLAHNTLTVNGQFQNVKGRAEIEKYGFDTNFKFAVSDLSGVYQNQLKSIKRGVAIVNQQYVMVQDEIENQEKTDTIRWTTMTETEVKIDDKNSFVLSVNGKKMVVKFETKLPIQLKTWSTDPKTDYDAPNKGKTLFGFEMILKPNSRETVTTLFLPSNVKNKTLIKNKALSAWK